MDLIKTTPLINSEKKEMFKDYLVLSTLSKIKLINIKDILYLEAEGRCTNIYTKDRQKLTSSKNLGNFEKQLVNTSFFRIHRKYIVNFNKVIHISKETGFYCVLKGGKNLPISSRKRDELMGYLRL